MGSGLLEKARERQKNLSESEIKRSEETSQHVPETGLLAKAKQRQHASHKPIPTTEMPTEIKETNVEINNTRYSIFIA